MKVNDLLTSGFTRAARISRPVSHYVEAVEKVNLARIRRVGRKCNLSGCSVYDDLMLGGGKRPPKIIP